MEKLGKSIKAFREAQGLTIEQLADTLSVNKQELEYIETLEDEKSIVDGSFLLRLYGGGCRRSVVPGFLPGFLSDCLPGAISGAISCAMSIITACSAQHRSPLLSLLLSPKYCI